jgi:hypothetical protein
MYIVNDMKNVYTGLVKIGGEEVKLTIAKIKVIIFKMKVTEFFLKS